MLFLIVLFCWSVNAADLNETLVVKTKQGFVRGFREGKENFIAFYGIPYATTPVGNDRFKAPLPPTPWTGVLNATIGNIVCPQRIRTNENLIYREDCLRINVFAPLGLPVNRKLPVIAYFHGGGFIHSGDSGGPHNLVRHDLIVVTFEYRVGVLGFLCLGTREAPGNAGLKDQIAALKWIRDNILQFGGDPDNVTAYGSSAGAASIDSLIIANKVNGLFHRAIAESGTAFSKDYDEDGRLRALKIARKMGFRGANDPRDLFEFFRNASVAEFETVEMNDFNVTDRIGPCIEIIESNSSIITEHPITLIKRSNYRKIPYITGFGNLEGLMHTTMFHTIKNQLSKNSSTPISPLNLIADKREWKKIQEKLRKAYFGKEDIKLDERFIQLCSEMYMQYPILVSAIYHARHSVFPVYLFEFTYDGLLGLPRDDFKYLVGARHSDFWAYVFTHGVTSSRIEDILVVDRLTLLIANFAKYGNPTPLKTQMLPVKWLPISGSNVPYLDIGSDLKMKTDIMNTRLQVIDEAYGYGISSSTRVTFSANMMCIFNALVILLTTHTYYFM